MNAALKPDAKVAAGLSLAALLLYGSTLSRSVGFGDSAELAAAAATLGIPHPPGYPLYTLLGHLYVRLVPGEPALGANVMSAVHGALCVGLLFLTARKLGADRLAASLASALFATGPAFWSNASVAEVYTTGLPFVLGTLWLLLDALETQRPARALWAAFVAGVGFAAHMFIATLGVGFLLLSWRASALASSVARERARFLAKSALATLAGASLYLYLPLRASMQPALNYAGVDRLDRFAWLVTGGEYKRWFLHEVVWTERTQLVLERVSEHLTFGGTLFALAGLALLARERRWLALALAAAIAGNVWFFFLYRVDDVEVFFLPCALVLALGVALALAHAFARARAASWSLGVVLPAIVVCAVLARATFNSPRVTHAHDAAANSVGLQLVASLPRGAVMLSLQTPAEWKVRTVFEDYFQKALGQRPDVRTLVTPTRATFQRALESGAPTFMYAHLGELDALATFEPFGPVFAVHARR